jgi:serine/threonine-protein kinase
VGTGQEETKDASPPVQSAEGQPSGGWGPTRIGELIGGKYRISRFLAEGGMGVVYEAQHAIVKRRFAVKFLRPDFARRRDSLGRFQREAETAGSLESEHIASVVDFGITNSGSAYIVMEYLVGESLASLLGREGRLPFHRAADLCMQACHGAETAHAAGIVHRDLKPHNVFMCRRDDDTDLLKILDFGIAKLDLIKNDQVSTQTGTVLGTPAYMSPEQARGDRSIDLRTDVYSLGAILFEMLSGKLPHPGESRNAVLYHISTRPAVSLATVAPELPQALVDVVGRALASSSGVRQRSAKAFAADLARFAKREVWPEPPSLNPAPFPAASLSSLEEAATAEPPVAHRVPQAMVPNRVGRRRMFARAAMLSGVIALVAAAGLLSSRWLRTAPGSPDLPPLASRNAVLPGVQTAPRPAADATPAPTLAAGPAPAPRPAEAIAPARALEPRRGTGPALKRAAGRPIGRSPGRPAAPASQRDAERPSPGAPADGSKAANASFPRATFDSKNPYASP